MPSLYLARGQIFRDDATSPKLISRSVAGEITVSSFHANPICVNSVFVASEMRALSTDTVCLSLSLSGADKREFPRGTLTCFSLTVGFAPWHWRKGSERAFPFSNSMFATRPIYLPTEQTFSPRRELLHLQ